VKRYPFIIAVILPQVIDFIVTSIGQPAEYWQGFQVTNEGSPIADWALHSHYGVFAGGFALYVLITFLLLKKLPWKYALWLGLWIFSAHMWASSSWASTMIAKAGIDVYYWYVVILYHGLLTIFLTHGTLSYYRNKKIL
jgi:hypothetical protein